jgi:hypothetical protein
VLKKPGEKVSVRRLLLQPYQTGQELKWVLYCVEMEFSHLT